MVCIKNMQSIISFPTKTEGKNETKPKGYPLP